MGQPIVSSVLLLYGTCMVTVMESQALTTNEIIADLENLQQKADHFWNFEEQPFKDEKTDNQISITGNLTTTLSPIGDQAISIRDSKSRVDLNITLGNMSCLQDPFTCSSGLTVAMVIKIGDGFSNNEIFGPCGVVGGFAHALDDPKMSQPIVSSVLLLYGTCMVTVMESQALTTNEIIADLENLQQKADHFWNFEEQPFKDEKTDNQISITGNLTTTLSPIGDQAISIRDSKSRVDLNITLGNMSCLQDPFTCSSGLTVAMVIKIGDGFSNNEIFGPCGVVGDNGGNTTLDLLLNIPGKPWTDDYGTKNSNWYLELKKELETAVRNSYFMI
ncbi:hypothetical protein AC249_AIPGENE29118 [Exaiptasia diaphana]|nr:hypothetical protein AC249_AIPGENE29118 [Exaiptasia diaphana]